MVSHHSETESLEASSARETSTPDSTTLRRMVLARKIPEGMRDKESSSALDLLPREARAEKSSNREKNASRNKDLPLSSQPSEED